MTSSTRKQSVLVLENSSYSEFHEYSLNISYSIENVISQYRLRMTRVSLVDYGGASNRVNVPVGE